MRKSQYFLFWMFSAKQEHYWSHFYNVFGITRSLTGDWTSRTRNQHYTTRLSRRQFTHLVIIGVNITPIYVTHNQTVKSAWITFFYSFNIYHQSSSIFLIGSTCKNHVYVETTVMWWRTPWFVLERCTYPYPQLTVRRLVVFYKEATVMFIYNKNKTTLYAHTYKKTPC